MMVNLLANNGYIVLNKTLMKKVGLYEAILLGELSAEYVYWKKRNELQDDYFYSTRENIEEQTMLTSRQQRSATERLKTLGILKVKQFGMPLKNWYSIKESSLVEILNGDGNFVNILANDNFIVVNKTVMKILGLNEAILLGELCAEVLGSEKSGTLEDGFFYSTREKIEEQTMLTPYLQRMTIDNLKKLQLLETVQRGMPLRTWYRLNEKRLFQLITNNELTQNSESLVVKKRNIKLLKNVTSSRKILKYQVVKNCNIKSSKNVTSSCKKMTHHVVKNCNTNNIYNKIDRLFNYIINKSNNLPKEFQDFDMDKVIMMLNKYDMLYNEEVLKIISEKNKEKIKNITYVIAMMTKLNIENMGVQIDRNRLVTIYDWCKEKQTLYEGSEYEIRDFPSYYYKSVVNEILKRNKTNYVANKAKEGEDDNEEYECPE